jgi:hypothetical protein
MPPVCELTQGQAAVGRFATRAQIALACCACAGATAFLYLVDPHRHAVYPQCLLYNTTGFYCAGCGATRALYALLHGRVIEALHDNLLFIGALPLIAFVTGSYFLAAWRRNAWPETVIDSRQLTRRAVGLVALLLVFSILRNLPGWPFEWLKPI